MSGGVERDVLVQSGHPTQATELLVDVGVVLQAKKVRQPAGIFVQDSQCLSAKEQVERQTDFGLGLHRAIHQPTFLADDHDVIWPQGGEIRIAQPGVATEQEGIQRPLHGGMAPGQSQMLQPLQFIRRQMRMLVVRRADFEIPKRMSGQYLAIPTENGVHLLLQMLQMLGDGVGVVALLPQEKFEVRHKIASQVGKQNLRLECTEQRQRGGQVAARTFFHGCLLHFTLHEVCKGLDIGRCPDILLQQLIAPVSDRLWWKNIASSLPGRLPPAPGPSPCG